MLLYFASDTNKTKTHRYLNRYPMQKSTVLENSVKVIFLLTKIMGWNIWKQKQTKNLTRCLALYRKKKKSDVNNLNFSLMWNPVSSQTNLGFSFNCSVQAIQRRSRNFWTEIGKGPMETDSCNTLNALQLHSESSSQTNSFSLV